MRVTCLCTFQDGERTYPPGAIIEVSDEDGRALIQKGSAKPAPSEIRTPPSTEGKPAAGRKGRRKATSKGKPAAPPGPEPPLDDDAIASALIELADDDSKVDGEGKPSLSAVSESLGREISQEDLDRVWASLQA